MLDINLLAQRSCRGGRRTRASAASRSTPRASKRSKRERKDIQTRTQDLQAKRNALSKQIGSAKGKGEDAAALLAEVAGIGDETKRLEGELDRVQRELRDIPARPAEPHARVHARRQVRRRQRRDPPLGHAANVRLSRCSDHTDLGEALGQLDFATAAKLSGARFSFLRGGLARLHRALAQFMLDTHTREHGYTECYTPYIVNAETLVGTTQLPKFEADMFSVRKGGRKARASRCT